MIKKLILLIFFTAAILFLNGFFRHDSDKKTFEYTCGKCHPAGRALEIEKTTIGWEKTVDWMQRKARNAFSDKDVLTIKLYLRKINTSYPEKLFRLKCATCHSLEKVEKLNLSSSQWKRLVMRERSRAIAWIALDEAEDIADYLSKNKILVPGIVSQESKNEELAEKKCLRCHVYETAFRVKKSREQWQAINERMRMKSPGWLTNEEANRISEFLCYTGKNTQ